MNLDIQCHGDLVSVVIAITESNLRGFGPLEIEMQVMVPGEAYASMDLDTRASNMLIDIAAPGLGHRSGQGHIWGVL